MTIICIVVSFRSIVAFPDFSNDKTIFAHFHLELKLHKWMNGTKWRLLLLIIMIPMIIHTHIHIYIYINKHNPNASAKYRMCDEKCYNSQGQMRNAVEYTDIREIGWKWFRSTKFVVTNLWLSIVCCEMLTNCYHLRRLLCSSYGTKERNQHWTYCVIIINT